MIDTGTEAADSGQVSSGRWALIEKF
jgi:hypothetical protein